MVHFHQAMATAKPDQKLGVRGWGSEREREGESERSVSLKVSLCNSGEKIC